MDDRYLVCSFLINSHHGITFLTYIFSMYLLFALQWEATARLDFLWRLQAQQEVEDMRDLREHNECLLNNILPMHVARHFLDRSKNDEVPNTLPTPVLTLSMSSQKSS